jgi:SPP1 gp7 family putative phage head morphogenesis protein
MNNSEYWKQRQEAKFIKSEKELNEFHNDLVKSFKRAKKSIHSTVNNFYMRYADNNELTYDVAMEELNFDELKELKDELGEFKRLSLDSIGEFNLELENMSMRARITRYQALEMQLDAILNNLYSIDYEAYGTDKLINIYKDQYYRTIFNIEKYKGFHSEFAQISNRAVEELINYPFSGASYSDRLWRQKDDLIFKLKDNLMDTIIKGTNPKELSEEFAKHFGTKEHEAYRLLQMENAFIVEQATLKGYEEDGIEKYEILATLDLKTSSTCRSQDGKVYDVKKALTGVNSPPFHWYCRTTTIPYIKDYEDGKRIARDPITGKNYNVPAEMKYEQWYNKYVANDPKALVEEKKIKNRYSDKKQHTLYKEVLGKESPKSFAAFQELKYNGINEWENLKQLYSDTKSGKVWLSSAFSTEKKFKKHIEKHLGEFGNITEDEYLSIARNLLASPAKGDIEGFISKEGFRFRYNNKTNDFAIGRADGYISTLYRPVDGYEHWLEQINDYKEE